MDHPMAKPESVPVPPAASKPRGKIVNNPELIAMNRIHRLLSQLSDAARVRVINWLKDQVDFPIIGDSNGES
jgi:hypothetical protein